MSATEDTQRTLRAHVENVRAWNLAALAQDYAQHAVMLFPQGCAVGRDAIAALFVQAPPVTGLVVEAESCAGEIGVIVYRADAISFATDTFVIRGGLIVSQTVVIQP